MRAYKSDATGRAEVLAVNASGCGDFGVTWRDVASDNALAEAQRIQADVEPERAVREPLLRDDGDGCWVREYHPRIMAELVALGNMACARYCHEAEALAESLRAVTADGGPLDQLAAL